MPALVTTLRDAQGRAIVSLPIAVRQALMACDELLRLHDMQFEIICEDCNRRHPTDPNRWTVTARHDEGAGAVNELICECKRRKFVAAF
jgi:hypothetical protein